MRKKKGNTAVEATQSLELKKHVAVIHSSSKITLLQRKIANALLYNAYDYLDKRDEHQIHVGTLCQLIGYASNDHRTIKNSLVNLLSTVIEWNLMNDKNANEEGVWNASSIIADASIEGAICTYSYSNKMRQLLYRPNMYGRLDMQVQARFQSSYGLALYENCNRYQDIGQTPWFELAKFRKLMGVEDFKYRVFRDFKQRVLNKAVEEVNKYSPIQVSINIKKENRKVIAIQFVMQNNALQGTLIANNDNQQLATTLQQQFGFTTRQVNSTLKKYEVKYVQEKIKLVSNSPSFKNGMIHNVAKYLLCALKDNYQYTNLIPKSTRTPLRLIDNPVQENNEREQYRRYQDEQALIMFQQYKKPKQNKILQAFEKLLGTSIYHDLYLRDGLNNILIKDQLAKFLLQYNQDILGTLMTFTEWQVSKRQKA